MKNIYILFIGWLVISNAVNVRYFTTKPGSKGKPNEIVYVLKGGTYPIYEIFDWKQVDKNLVGEHIWIRVKEKESHWVYFKKENMFIRRK
jgi:hypothetical protein